jgi:transcriptional regulator with GAF, ATPase, and Fis domain
MRIKLQGITPQIQWRAAQLLGMTFRTLQYRLEKFGIKRV